LRCIFETPKIGKKKIKIKVLNWEFLLELADEPTDEMQMSVCDNNVVNIDQYKEFKTSSDKGEERGVNKWHDEPKVQEKIGQAGVPSSRSLFQAIDGLVELAYKGRMMRGNKATWLFHVDFLIERSMEKSIWYVKLSNWPVKVHNQC
jgi:hypothetical protein